MLKGFNLSGTELSHSKSSIHLRLIATEQTQWYLPQSPNTTIYVGCCEHPYKRYYSVMAGLLLHYKIPKAAAMRLLK